MSLPNQETVKKLMSSSKVVRTRVLAIARKLEALNEYHPDQALIVAADIVMNAVSGTVKGPRTEFGSASFGQQNT